MLSPIRSNSPSRQCGLAARERADLFHLRRRSARNRRWRNSPASRSTLLVRGMTTMPCCTSQRRHTCAALLPCALPISVEHRVAFGAAARDRTIGDHRDAMSRRQAAITLQLVEERMALDLIADQRLARQSFTASSISATVKFETPMCRVRPSRFILHSAPIVSASGMRGLGQWISSRSMLRSRSCARLSCVERSRSGGARLRRRTPWW